MIRKITHPRELKEGEIGYTAAGHWFGGVGQGRARAFSGDAAVATPARENAVPRANDALAAARAASEAAQAAQAAATAAALPLVAVTGTSQAMAVNTRYLADNSSLVTFTLPAAAAVGDRLIVYGKGAGKWKIAQQSGQTIHCAAESTTAGAGGYLLGDYQYAAIELVCIAADTAWLVCGGMNLVYTLGGSDLDRWRVAFKLY